jgi:uncharacterized membrane protein HdeD (DUF308 family)
MIGILAKNWWALALRGVAAIVFGLIAIAYPAMALQVLILLFAAYLLVDGVFAIVAGVRAAEHHQRWFALIIEGVLDIAAAVVIVVWPALSLLFFIYVIGFWAIMSGVALLAAAIRLRREHGEWLLILSGVLSLVWGVLVVLFPIAGVLVWALWIGAYALIFGVLMIVLAFRLRHRAFPAVP